MNRLRARLDRVAKQLSSIEPGSPEQRALAVFLDTHPSYDAMIEYSRNNRLPADMERACELIYGDPVPTPAV